MGRVGVTVLMIAPILALILIQGVSNLYWSALASNIIPMLLAPLLVMGVCDEMNLYVRLFDRVAEDFDPTGSE